MHFLMTTDVESFSIPLNREDSDVAKQIYEVGFPHLLDLYARYDIKCTFYFTGMFAEQSPESVELVKEHGHEIGVQESTKEYSIIENGKRRWICAYP